MHRTAALSTLLVLLTVSVLGAGLPQLQAPPTFRVPPEAIVHEPGSAVVHGTAPALHADASVPVFGGELRMPRVRVGEPGAKAAPDGTLYVYAPGYLALSTDGGATFTEVKLTGRTGPVSCGCDSDVAIDDQNNLLYTDLAFPITVNVGWTSDQGKDWVTNPQATLADRGVDRQWIDTDGKSTTYMSYRQGPNIFLVTAPASPVPVFTPSTPTTSSNTGRAGYLAVDRVRNQVYTFYMSDLSIRVDRVTDLGQTVTDLLVADNLGDPADSFPAGAVDDAGNVYVVWTSRETVGGNTVATTYYAFSTDQGDHFSAPIKLNSAPATTVYPWAVAGADGKLGVVYYGSTDAALPGNVAGDWYVYYNFIPNAHSAAPTLGENLVVQHKVKTGPICTGGTGCGQSGDRSFLDYFGVAKTKDGRAIMAFNDQETLAQRATPYIHFVQQVDGPRLV